MSVCAWCLSGPCLGECRKAAASSRPSCGGCKSTAETLGAHRERRAGRERLLSMCRCASCRKRYSVGVRVPDVSSGTQGGAEGDADLLGAALSGSRARVFRHG